MQEIPPPQITHNFPGETLFKLLNQERINTQNEPANDIHHMLRGGRNQKASVAQKSGPDSVG